MAQYTIKNESQISNTTKSDSYSIRICMHYGLLIKAGLKPRCNQDKTQSIYEKNIMLYIICYHPTVRDDFASSSQSLPPCYIMLVCNPDLNNNVAAMY